MNVSQPNPNDTIQMNRVRQVSIVERDVADTVRVTERPKKLKPLFELAVYNCEVNADSTYPILIMMRTLLTAILGL